MSLLSRANRRYLQRHPWQWGLAVLGVALGVAVMVAMDLANDSARRAFAAAADAVAGRATHQISGGPGGVPEGLHTHLKVEMGIDQAAPVLEAYVGVPADAGVAYQLLGLDPLAEGAFRGYVADADGNADLERLIREPGTVLVSPQAAQRLGVGQGDTVQVEYSGRLHALTVVGILAPGDEVQQSALRYVLVADMATAQELTDRLGQLSRIDLVAPEAGAEAWLNSLAAALPPGISLNPSSLRRGGMEQMVSGFRTNLTALSLLAMLVGLFLIYNTMTFTVLQRRSLTGMLRALGATRREVFRQIMAEALVIGLVGAAGGVALGVAMGQALTDLVVRSISDLYFVLNVAPLRIAADPLWKGFAVGTAATAAAALLPAWEAAATPPRAVLSRSHLEQRTRRAIPRLSLAGVVLLLLGAVLVSLPLRSTGVSFAGLFALTAGGALLVPAALVGLMTGVRPLLGALTGVTGRMAARSIVVSLSRTGVAAASLAVAVAAVVGVAVMIHSFRQSFVTWLDYYLAADVYVAVAAAGDDPGQRTLDADLVENIASLPQVSQLSRGRRIELGGRYYGAEVFALDLPRQSFDSLRLAAGEPQAAREAFYGGEGVLVSEPYAFRHQVEVGESVVLPTDRGPQPFPVVGIYYDYGSDAGVVTMERTLFDRYWDVPGVASLGLYLTPGADVEAVMAQLQTMARDVQNLVVRSNQGLRDASLAVFDRTFVITNVLRLLAVGVAFIGVLSALMAMQLERGRELAILRASGVTPAQVWQLVAMETGLVGMAAGVLAVPLGLMMAVVLVFVINRRSFGWSMEFAVEPQILLQAVLLAVIAALLAAVYPALRMSRVSPALALRND